MTLTDDALRTKPTAQGQLVGLRPLRPEHADAFWRSLHDPEARRLTGTHTEFRRDEIDAWLASRSGHHARLDLAIHRRDDRYVGELAINELDPANESVGVRIALASIVLAGKGYGSDAMRTILAHGFDTIGDSQQTNPQHAPSADAASPPTRSTLAGCRSMSARPWIRPPGRSERVVPRPHG